jgi:predicted aspartyl protease
MPSLAQNFEKSPTLFVRLKGRNGRTVECRALIDPAAELCVIPKVDAYSLGYTEAFQDTTTDYITRPPNLITLTTCSGYVNAPKFSMIEVSLGSNSYRDVDFLAYDLPQESCLDVLLGRSLLDRTKLKIDYGSRSFIIEG